MQILINLIKILYTWNAQIAETAMHMLHDLPSSTKYTEVKRTAEGCEGWRATNRNGML